MFDLFFILFICMSLVLLIPIIIHKFFKFYNYDISTRLEKENKEKQNSISTKIPYESDLQSFSSIHSNENGNIINKKKSLEVKKCAELWSLKDRDIAQTLDRVLNKSNQPKYMHMLSVKQLGKKWDLDNLMELVGEEKVAITKTKNSVLNYFFADSMKEQEMTWNDFIIDGIKKNHSSDKLVSYNAQNELPDKLKQDIKIIGKKDVISVLLEDETNTDWFPIGYRTENLVYWFGFDRYFTPLHYDHEDGLLCCLHGRKDVWLLDPIHTDKIGGSDVFVYSDIFDIRKRDDLPGRYHITLKPGDTLFIPQGWWHHVESIPELGLVKSLDTKVPYHLAITFWLYPKDKEYSFDYQLDKIGNKQSKIFKKMVKVEDLSPTDKQRLESTGLWSPSEGDNKEIENPLFTDKYD